MEVNNMYVESIREMQSAAPQQVSQTADAIQPVNAQSTEGEAETTSFDKTLQNQASSQSQTIAEAQSAETEKLKKAIEKMNEQLPNSEAKFKIHEATNRVMIKLVDKDTQEVIKEIPPEKTLDILAKCMEIAGVLVDQKL